MYELGLLEDFLKVPHQQVTSVGGMFGDFAFRAADFSHLPTHCKFVALMPQWDFLNFLSSKAKEVLRLSTCGCSTSVDLIRDEDRISGSAQTPERPDARSRRTW